MTNTEIHGIPAAPLGHRLLQQGENLTRGAQWWDALDSKWISQGVIDGENPPEDSYIYAVPLNDGYEYFEARTTTIQAGDETFVRPDYWYAISDALIGQSNEYSLRRPKAPLPGEEGSKVYTFRPIGGKEELYLLPRKKAKIISDLLEALKDQE